VRRLLYGSFSKKDARNLTPSSQSFVGCNSELNAVVAMIKWCGDSNVAYEKHEEMADKWRATW
jgi:hypothetical protein